MDALKRFAMATTIVAILLGWAPIRAALAADFTVTRTDDPSPGACTPDDCSLREAVIAANNQGGHDRILLANQVYSLTRPVSTTGDFGFAQVADLDVHDDLTIEGPTGSLAKATIDANGATMGDRAFEIHGVDTDVSLQRLVITAAPDVLRGSSRSEAILALAGADEVFGRGGNDVICAGGGKDTLRGEGGNDQLFGQDGADTLNTRDTVEGNHLANGGSGTDSCKTDPLNREVSC